MKVRATAEEIQNQIATLMAEADQLKAKADSEEGLTPDEQARLEEVVGQIEQLQADLAAAQTEQRMAAAKERMAAPTRPAPTFSPKVYATPKATVGEALSLFLRSKSPEADNSAANAYKCASLGINLGNNAVKLPVNYRGLNFKQRTILSKGGTGTGAELVWQSYSDKVVEYLTYSSPLLGLLGSETTGDGNLRTYFKIDDTAMESTYTSASSETETNPTIPETNLATSNVVIGCFDITSGYQKVSFNELRDSYINLEDKIARANANSHARKIEREVLSATGNGTTGVKGIEASATALTAVAAWDAAALEGLYFSVLAQYRKDCVFVANGDTYAGIYSVLKNDVGDSLFGKNIQDEVEYDVLLGKKFIQSDYVTADTVLFFNPNYYMLRMVEGQLFQQFTEKFFPNVAWAGIMTFGGAWLGPTTAAKKLALDAS